MTRDFVERRLIVNDRVEEYDGTTAVVRSKYLSAEEIEFLRWRAERWMKLRHIWPVLRHSPAFVLRHGPAMLAHTFRGCSLRSLIGLESERAAFARYRAIRRAEREDVPAVDETPDPPRMAGIPPDRVPVTFHGGVSHFRE